MKYVKFSSMEQIFRKFSVFILLQMICYNSVMAFQTKEYDIRDKQIFADVVKKLSPYKHLPTGQLVVKAGLLFVDAPYVAKTLEVNENEELVVNLREFDCTTFVENCLALALVSQKKNPDFNDFLKILKRIRYRNGVLKDYTSRLHYFSDWMYDNTKKNLLKNVAVSSNDTTVQFQVNYMSTHPQSYPQLMKNSALIAKIAFHEKTISKRFAAYVPTFKVNLMQGEIQDGDILGITTNINGMDVKHVVMAYQQGGSLHILHASQRYNKVLVSDETLEDYLRNDSRATGIVIRRPL